MNSMITPIDTKANGNYSANPRAKDDSKNADGFSDTLSFAINLSSEKQSLNGSFSKNNQKSARISSADIKADNANLSNTVVNLKSSSNSKARLKPSQDKFANEKSIANTDANTNSKANVKVNNNTPENTDVNKNPSLEKSSKNSDFNLTDDEKQILNDIKDVFNDVLGISDDELEEAMSELGMSLQDLLNPGSLARLLFNLSGNSDSDISVFLSDPSFNDIFSKLNDIRDSIMSLPSDITINAAFESENEIDIPETDIENVSAENLKNLSDIVNNGQNSKAGIEKVAIDISGFQNEISSDESIPKEDENLLSGIDDKNQSMDEAAPVQENSEISDDKNAETDGNPASKEDTSGAFKEAENNGAQKDGQSLSKLKNTIFENDIIKPEYTNTASVQSVNVSVTEFSTQPVMQFRTVPGIDAADLINQIVSHARTTITDAVKSMEMELNPQSLGKMLMKVTEQAGTLSAHITVQNEDVKEALSNQMALLKTNLEASGMKVDEVTVTADSHAFERNLEEGQETNTNFTENGQDQNGSAEENAYEESRRRGIGSLNLNNMTGSDLQNLSEEELLQAQIMKDSGNQMNIKA